MLINLHNPRLLEISSHDRAPDHGAFYTVQIAETRGSDTANAVPAAVLNLFVDSDWASWDAIVEQVTDYRQTQAVRALGAEHGKAAGSWVIDGNTDVELARKFITGYDDGDPEILDACPSPLSGEWADGVTEQEVYRAAGIEIDSLDNNGESVYGPDNLPEHLIEAYNDAYTEAWWAEVIRAATIVAEPEWRQTACRGCGLDIEGAEGGTEWRDRGNNTMCPGDVDAHEPVSDSDTFARVVSDTWNANRDL